MTFNVRDDPELYNNGTQCEYFKCIIPGSEVTNGDKLVLKKLDDQISIVETNNDDDEIDEIEYKKVSIDYTGLLDKNCSQDNILKDLLDLPLKNTSKVRIHSFILIINLMKIILNLY